MVDVRGLLGLAAAAGHLFLALVVGHALRAAARAAAAGAPPAGPPPDPAPGPALDPALPHRVRRGPARPLVCLCLALYVWNFSEFARVFFRDEAWHLIALTGASLAPAFFFHFVVRYLDAVARFWRPRAALYALSAAFAAVTAAALVLEPVRAFVIGPLWNLAFLALLFPLPVRAVFLLRGALRATADRAERNRLKYVLAALLISVGSGFVDLACVSAPALPPIGNVGQLLAVLLLGTAILRHRLLEIEVAFWRGFLILLLCTGGTLSYFLSFRFLPDESGVRLFSVLAVTALLFALFRKALDDWHAEAERTRRLALLGEMAASVAHEIKNPLSSLKGALQYLQEERRTQARPAGDADPAAAAHAARVDSFFAIMAEEIERLNRLATDFQYFTRPVEIRGQRVAVNPLVAATVALLVPGLPAGIAVRQELDPAGPEVEADPELLRQALINLIKNAAEAQPEGGEVRVATRRAAATGTGAGATGPALVEIEVADRGVGIEPEDLGRIGEPLYTTKRRGSGLGLAVVKRVVEAHRGRLDVESRAGQGSRFLLRLPAARPASEVAPCPGR